MAVGAEVEINDMPGYMPLIYNEELNTLLEENCIDVVGEDEIVRGRHGTGSTDLGDFSCIIPTSRIRMGGMAGIGHSRTYEVVDKEVAYVVPAKVLAMTCIDLLYDRASAAKRIIECFEPSIPRDDYTEFMHRIVS
jgi:metal-dependent amidase/aminoacylase/carboxypeptidase family protein